MSSGKILMPSPLSTMDIIASSSHVVKWTFGDMFHCFSTSEDCAAVNEKLDMKMVKTLFLCDRKQTQFFLFVTAGAKPFRSKEFARVLGVSRLSFAPAELMKSMLGTEIGAATMFSTLLDTAKEVQVVVGANKLGMKKRPTSMRLKQAAAAVVAVLCRASKLVILSDIAGFYDSDPRLHPNAKLVEQITHIDEHVKSLAGGAGSRRGTGGMRTKLQAAQLATAQGIDTVITNGKNPDGLYRIIKGEQVGTLFVGREK